MSTHKWFDRKFRGFSNPVTCCQHCGIVKRADGKNKPCPGKVRVELRENRIKTGAFGDAPDQSQAFATHYADGRIGRAAPLCKDSSTKNV